MNRKIASALVIAAAAAAGTAFAETPTVTPPFTSTANRADVQAELQAHKKAGVNTYSSSYNQLRGFKSQLSREQVVADYIASRDVVAATNAEDSSAAFQVLNAARPANTSATLAGQPVNPQ